MYRRSRHRLPGYLLIAMLAAACSSEEPAQQAAPAAAPAPAEPTAAPAEAPADEAPADEESVAQAEAMDETAGDAAADSADEPIRLAAEQEPASEADARFKEGTHYRRLPVAQPTTTPPGTIEVVEIFWYGCPHCYSLEPHIEAWKANDMPADAALVRMPAALNRGWQVHARVFYTAEALGVLDQVHQDLFREIHGKGKRLDTEESLVEFFGRYGVTEQDFMDAFNSFAVQNRLRQADSKVRRYRITGVPAVVVNGKYVTGADLAGGEAQLFEVINYLVERERA